MRITKKLFGLYFNLKSKSYKVKNIEELKISGNETFLVISNTALGDTLLSTPAIKSLKKSFPNSKIVALIHKNYIPLFKNFSYIDTIIPFYGGYKKFFTTIKNIKKYKPTISLIFHGNGPQDIQISILSGCEFILKHPNRSPLKKFLSYDFKDKNQHTIEDRLDLIRKIGGKNLDISMEIGELNNNFFKEKFSKFKNFIGFQIGAADSYKMWPIENFIELAKKIEENIVITGIKSEWTLAQKIVDEVGNRVVNMCGKCSIEELPYLIDNLKLLITNDTGTMHLAIALKTPTISLFSATNAQQIGAYQDFNIHKTIQKNGNFIQGQDKKKRDDSAMRLIDVDEVYQKYLELSNETT